MKRLTVNGEISKGSARGTLDFGVMAGEKEENGVERVSADLTNFFFGDLCKCECGATLEVNVLREGEDG